MRHFLVLCGLVLAGAAASCQNPAPATRQTVFDQAPMPDEAARTRHAALVRQLAADPLVREEGLAKNNLMLAYEKGLEAGRQASLQGRPASQLPPGQRPKDFLPTDADLDAFYDAVDARRVHIEAAHPQLRRLPQAEKLAVLDFATEQALAAAGAAQPL